MTGPLDATAVLAHGPGADALPIGGWPLVAVVAALLVIASQALRLWWPRPAAEAPAAPPDGAAAATRVAARVALRAVGLVAFGTTVAALWFGTTNGADNLGPTMVHVVLWVGVAVASVLLGGVWAAVNPFDTIAALAGAIRHRRRPTPMPPASPDADLWRSAWPAAAGLAGIVWFERCYHAPFQPRSIAVAATLYSAVVLAATARFGRGWLRSSEAFGAWFGLLAAASPVVVERSGRPRLRAPFIGIAAIRPRRGLAAVAVVALAGVLFDGVSRTVFWARVLGESEGWASTALNTVGLVWVIGMVTVALAVASYAVAMVDGRDPLTTMPELAPVLAPIAVVALLSHSVSTLVLEGQALIALVSDPFGRDWDLFGGATYVVDTELVSPTVLGWVALVALVAGHVAAVAIAHVRAARAFDPVTGARASVAVGALVVVSAAASVLLLL
jgi:hypothetical protein